MRELCSNFVKASKQNMGVHDYCDPDYSALDLSCLRFIALFFIRGLFGDLLWLKVSTVLTLSSTCTVNTSERGGGPVQACCGSLGCCCLGHPLFFYGEKKEIIKKPIMNKVKRNILWSLECAANASTCSLARQSKRTRCEAMN